MRLRVMILPLLVLLTLTAAAANRGRTPRAPKEAKVTGACTPSGKAQITPAEHRDAAVGQRRVGARRPRSATSWTITPKDTLDWPWAERSFTGTPAAAATTPQPLPSAIEKHPYRYNVLVQCADGTTQDIDPDIIIGGEQ